MKLCEYIYKGSLLFKIQSLINMQSENTSTKDLSDWILDLSQGRIQCLGDSLNSCLMCRKCIYKLQNFPSVSYVKVIPYSEKSFQNYLWNALQQTAAQGNTILVINGKDLDQAYPLLGHNHRDKIYKKVRQFYKQFQVELPHYIRVLNENEPDQDNFIYTIFLKSSKQIDKTTYKQCQCETIREYPIQDSLKKTYKPGQYDWRVFALNNKMAKLERQAELIQNLDDLIEKDIDCSGYNCEKYRYIITRPFLYADSVQQNLRECTEDQELFQHYQSWVISLQMRMPVDPKQGINFGEFLMAFWNEFGQYPEMQISKNSINLYFAKISHAAWLSTHIYSRTGRITLFPIEQ